MAQSEQISVDGHILVAHHFGSADNSGMRVYLQGALHADEIAATVALEALLDLLGQAETDGRVTGQITVVPHCNPLGLNQFSGGRHLGRFSMDDDRNFNRGFVDVSQNIVSGLAELAPEERNRAAAIRIGREFLKQRSACLTGRPALQNALMLLSWGAERIYDVHTDMEALVHLYTSEASWPAFKGLAARTETAVVMLADATADSCFDEAHALAWRSIAPSLNDMDEGRCAACTLELRGLADVTPSLATDDASALFGDLVACGVIEGNIAFINHQPHVLSLDGVDMVTSPRRGVFVPLKTVGDMVSTGDELGLLLFPDIVDPAKRWQSLKASTDGLIFARWHQRVIDEGMAAYKIAGNGDVVRAGAKLLD